MWKPSTIKETSTMVVSLSLPTIHRCFSTPDVSNNQLRRETNNSSSLKDLSKMAVPMGLESEAVTSSRKSQQRLSTYLARTII